MADSIARRVVDTEHRFGLDLSSPLTSELRGVGLAWANGEGLADLSGRSGLSEGDIVFALQKTLDLCRQIRQAAPASHTPSAARLAGESGEADPAGRDRQLLPVGYRRDKRNRQDLSGLGGFVRSTPKGIRTPDLHLERVASWATRQWGQQKGPALLASALVW